MLPPVLLRVRIEGGKRRIRLWLPLVLLWPAVGVAVLLGTPVVVLTAALYWHRGCGRPILRTAPLLLSALASLRGLRCNVISGADRVFVSID